MTRLTDAERETLRAEFAARINLHDYNGLCPDTVEGWGSRDSECSACQMMDDLQRLAARLARVEALADEWESRPWHPGNPRDDCALVAAHRLRAALAHEAEGATS